MQIFSDEGVNSVMGVTFFEPPFFTKVFIKEAIFVLKIGPFYMLCMGVRGLSVWIFNRLRSTIS